MGFKALPVKKPTGRGGHNVLPPSPGQIGLRRVYNDTVTSFENLLTKNNSFTIHHQNIQSLAMEICNVCKIGAIHNLPGGNLREVFVRNNHNYSLRSESELLLPNVNTVFKGENSISYFGSVIWNSIPTLCS